eukprot:905659-Prymnesium_polylepis.1
MEKYHCQEQLYVNALFISAAGGTVHSRLLTVLYNANATRACAKQSKESRAALRRAHVCGVGGGRT